MLPKLKRSELSAEVSQSERSLYENNYSHGCLWALRRRLRAFYSKLDDMCFCQFPIAIFVPLNGTQTFLRISPARNIPQTWFFARQFKYSCSFASLILEFICWMVLMRCDGENRQLKFYIHTCSTCYTSDFNMKVSECWRGG